MIKIKTLIYFPLVLPMSRASGTSQKGVKCLYTNGSSGGGVKCLKTENGIRTRTSFRSGSSGTWPQPLPSPCPLFYVHETVVVY